MTTILDGRGTTMSDETWVDLCQLAAAILDRAAPVSRASFASWPQVRRMLDTDLVVDEAGSLTFVLPVFEQYFAGQAIGTGRTSLAAAATSVAFPNWRYALAFAVSTARPGQQKSQMLGLAEVNPAAVFWILAEIRVDMSGESHTGADDATIAAMIAERGAIGTGEEPRLAVRAGLWLREAEQSLLRGLGPLAEHVVRHRDGVAVQWGCFLHSGYLSLARARDRVAPAVVELDEIHPHVNLATGWSSWTQIRFPTSDLHRWLYAQGHLQEQFQRLMQRRTLLVPATSWLARERTYHLSRFVFDHQAEHHRQQAIVLDELREKVSSWVAHAATTERTRWGNEVESDDIRWLDTQLALEDGGTLRHPWPDRDQPRAGFWTWESLPPERILALATEVIREALIGYRQLVDLNFPRFGHAMGLYSMLPLKIDGHVIEPPAQGDRYDYELFLFLHPRHQPTHDGLPVVDLTLISDSAAVGIWDRGEAHFRRTIRTRFGRSLVQQPDLQLHLDRRATNLAYRWLATDLAALGWLVTDARFYE